MIFGDASKDPESKHSGAAVFIPEQNIVIK